MLKPKKMKSVPASTFSSSIYCEMVGLYAFEELSLLCLCHNIVDFMPYLMLYFFPVFFLHLHGFINFINCFFSFFT